MTQPAPWKRALRQWWKRHASDYSGKSIATVLAEHCIMPPGTAASYAYGKITAPSVTYAAKLYELTGLEIFKPYFDRSATPQWHTDLRNWWDQQKEQYPGKRLIHVLVAAGMNRATAQGYTNGKNINPSSSGAQTLYALTGLPVLKQYLRSAQLPDSAPHPSVPVPAVQPHAEPFGLQLGTWIRSHGLTLNKFAAQYGFPRSTVQDWASGKRTTLQPDAKRRLHEITGLPCFASEPPSQSPDRPATYTTEVRIPEPRTETGDPLYDRLAAAAHTMGASAAELLQLMRQLEPPSGEWKHISQSAASAHDHVQTTRTTFYRLVKELEYFKNHPDARRQLRERIRGQDVGLMIGYLNALFTDDMASRVFLEKELLG